MGKVLLAVWLLTGSLMAQDGTHWVRQAFFGANESAEVMEIDAELRELRGMKRGYESRALRHENQAERLQFEDQAYLETRRHLQLAQENRDKAARIQERIDQLEKQRAKLAR